MTQQARIAPCLGRGLLQRGKGVRLGAAVSCDMCRMQMPDMAGLTEEREREREI